LPPERSVRSDMIYAVIDTNVLVSSLLTKNEDAATVRVMHAVTDGIITPLYHMAMLLEYAEVLSRPKFGFSETRINAVMKMMIKYGVQVFPKPTGEILVDMDDLIFYEVAMEKRDDGSYLVTGNKKHYPVRDFIVTPSQMLEIIDNYSGGN